MNLQEITCREFTDAPRVYLANLSTPEAICAKCGATFPSRTGDALHTPTKARKP